MSNQPYSATPVTVLGLGLMGSALAAAFLAAGHPTTVWNRSTAKAKPLVDKGAKAAASVEEAVAASPLVVVCVSDYPAVRALLEPLGPALDGRVLVNLTSGTSGEARELAQWADGKAAAYLDGAILATPGAVGSEAAVLFSGPRAAFELHEPAFRSLGEGAAYLGEDHGLASLYDVAVLGLMWQTLNGFLHGAALLGAAGVEAKSFAGIAAESLRTVAGWLPGNAEQIDAGDFQAVDATLDTHLAAMDHLVEESEALGVDVELPRAIRDLARRAADAGYGGGEYAVLVKLFEAPGSRRSPE
ncbi:NAD(P)-dependent oxidoreductase [Actinocorallia sp. A-T 12471]|uniref:NAD(P)-dependent oxidoreductase n=1 Tax=Actinocorallia sp. A-T 12471 TaxID=3089813 RepID=UPI0029CF4611|nr:NAD(P)-binding domain-containing protein [Actinocorallia sp. A-T 12471]MDX6738442.1 NAD(P)-binding domain-containing protein [Actinocorallia sp. A-T 12471]